MDVQAINTPEKLHQAIGKFLQSDYSHEDLVKTYEDARKCDNGFRTTYSALPTVPVRNDDPLDGLQDIWEWCDKSVKIVDDIVYNFDKQTISETIHQFKKLRDFANRVLSLVNSKLKEESQKEARTKVEKDYKNLNDKVSRLKPEKMLLIDQAKVLGDLQLEEQEILRRETEEIVQIYLSKDTTFKDRLSQLNSEINEMLEALDKLIGSNTPTGKILDIYCKLKDIPLQQQIDDIGYAYCPINDLTDVICNGCNRLYTCVDNVIKTFEEIQTKAEQKMDEAPPQDDLEPAETGGNATTAKIINIGNFKGVLGNVQAESVQTGDHSSIHKQMITTEKKKSILIRILKIIVKIIGAIIVGIIVAIIIDILGDFGWLQSIKELIYSSLPK